MGFFGPNVSGLTDTVKANDRISSVFKTAYSNADSTLNSNVNGTISDVQKLFKQNNVIGISTTRIPTMIDGIENYLLAVTSAIGKLTNYDPKIAFRGEYATSMEQYIAAMISVSEAVVSNMKAFEDQLQEIKKAYETKASNSASTIKTMAQSASSAFTNYSGGSAS